jgi:hypothetical protein
MVLAEGYTIFPRSLDTHWAKAEAVASNFQGENWPVSNPFRQGLAAYTRGAGIESGYGFFAPNVPNSYKLVFEIHYADGEVEYALPQVSGRATGTRLANVFDRIDRAQSDSLRELMLKMLAYSTWQTHPGATMIRAVFGVVRLPSPADYASGQKESYEFLYAYDFTFPSEVH